MPDQWPSGSSIAVSTLDGRYEPQIPGICLPILAESPQTSAALAAVANQVRASRIICPKSGSLRDISIMIGTTGGNCILGAYDTGDISNGNRTLLGNSGAQAVVANGNWQTWDPGDKTIQVVQGQQLDLACIFDSAVPQFGRGPALANNSAPQLPANFNIVPGGALPKLTWTFAAGAFQLPVSIAEANCAGSLNFPMIIARIA